MTSLPQNRAVALRVLQGVLREHRPLDEQADVLTRGMEQRDRAFVRLTVATTLRRIGQIDLVLKKFLDRPLPAKLAAVRDVLRLGTAQLLFLDTPPHAVVDTCVELVKQGKFAPYAGLVNAVLRRVAQQGRSVAEAIDAARFNTPKWLWTSWVESYGEETARAIGAANLHEAPLDLSLKRQEDAEAWAARLEAEVLPTRTLRRTAGGSVGELPGFSEGAWWVQDAAAALPARLLGTVEGKSVIDMCAAPGGKTMQLADAGASVTAIDKSARRLRRVAENLERIGRSAEIVEADAVTWRPGSLADAVLLDAPCSSTGTIRRHPDVARLKTPDDIAALAATQQALLRAAVEMVRPGGLIVYCVCSIQHQEGPAQVATAVDLGLPVERVPIEAHEVGGLRELVTDDGDLRTLPCHLSDRGGMDGFYAARLRRL